MSFLGLMTVRAHEAVVADYEARLGNCRDVTVAYKRDADAQTARADKLATHLEWADNQTRAACADRDNLATELAALKAKRDQQTRNLKQFRKIT